MEIPDKLEPEAQDALRQLRAGQQQGLRRLVEALGPRLFAFLKGLLGNVPDAEDALQETFATVCSKAAQQNQGGGSAKGWIYRIARNQGLQMLRRRQSDARRPGAPLPAPAPDPAQAADRALLLEDVDRAVQSLPVELKIPFLMRECLDLTYAQIAELTDRSVSQVTADLYRARQLLREYIRA